MARSASFILAFILALAVFATGHASNEKTPEPIFGEILALSDTDYSDPDLWLRFGGDKSKDVDIFVVYPTVTFSKRWADMPYMRINDPAMHTRAAAWLLRMDEIIAQAGNVYAPLYRQLNGAALAMLGSARRDPSLASIPRSDVFAAISSMPRHDVFATISPVPRSDVFAAFDYYLTHINKGERPFILFGHSQGAFLVAEIATALLGNEKYQQHNKNHIITYAIGYSVTDDGIAKNPHLKFSERKDDIGVIVSWNTTAPSEIASGAYKRFGTWNPNALITNPLSWTTDELLRHASVNTRSVISRPGNPLEILENYANALIDMEHRVLVTTTVDESRYETPIPPISKFHTHDIGLYHDSIRQNIKDRIKAFRAR